MNQKQNNDIRKSPINTQEKANGNEPDLNKTSSIFETHYEKVLSIISKIKDYLKSTNQKKLLEDLIWVTKIITNRSLYNYEMKEEESEDADKNQKKNSAYFKFVRFVAKYNDEIIHNNKNSFIGAINAGISKSNNNSLLLLSSIKLKKPEQANISVSPPQEKNKLNHSMYEDKGNLSGEKEEEKNNKNDSNYKIKKIHNKNNSISNVRTNLGISKISTENKRNIKNNKHVNNSKIKERLFNKAYGKNKLKNLKSTATTKHFNKSITHYNNPHRLSSCHGNNLTIANDKIKPRKSSNSIICDIDYIPKKSKVINLSGINYVCPAKKKFNNGSTNNILKTKKPPKNLFNRKNGMINCKNNNNNNHSLINNHPLINTRNKTYIKLTKGKYKSIDKLNSVKKNLNETEKTETKNKEENKTNKAISTTPENRQPKNKYKKGGFFSFLNQIIVNLYGDEQNNNNQNNNSEIIKNSPVFIPFKSLKEQYSDSIKTIMNKDFDIFALKEIVGYKNIMPIIGSVILDTFHLINDEIISLKKLESFLTSVSNEYIESTLYHNSIHGTDVTHTLSFFFLYSNIEEICQTNILDLLGIFISALGHDIGHPGLTNNYHINASSDLAITYNDISCLENFHTSLLFRVLRKEENNIFEKITGQNYKTIRKRMISQILSTDMANHGKVMSIIKSKIDVYKLNIEEDKSKKNKFVLLSGNDKTKFDEQQSLLDFLIHSADLAHNTKDFNISLKWVQLLTEEFWLQGDKERASGLPISFLCDREKYDVPSSQVGFIKAFVITTYDCLVTMFPSLKYTIDYAEKNVKEWQKLIDQKRLKGWTPRNNKSH